MSWQQFMQAPTPGAAFRSLLPRPRPAQTWVPNSNATYGGSYQQNSGGRGVPPSAVPRQAGDRVIAPQAPATDRRRPPVEPLRTAPIMSAVTAVPRNSSASQASVAAQNAAQGVKAQPSWSWDANPAMRDAAMAAGAAAAAARDAQGGRGYLSAGGAATAAAPAFNPNAAPGVELGQVAPQNFSLSPAQVQEQQAFDANLPMTGMAKGATSAAFSPAASGGLPDTSNPASDAYWQRADIQEWASKNGELANNLRRRHGLSELGATAAAPAVAPAGFDPGQTAFSEPVAPVATDPVQRVAPAQMTPGPETGADLAQEFNRERLERVKLGALRGGENLASPAHFQPGTQEQPAWPRGWFQ